MRHKSLQSDWTRLVLVVAGALAPLQIARAENSSPADRPVTQPSTSPAVASSIAPTTQPIAQEVAALVAQLGDPDPHVRNRASKRLAEIGAPALPALKAVADSADLEVQMRSREIAADLERPPAPNPPGRVATANGALTQSVQMSVANNTRVIEVNDMGRSIHIEQTPEKITMTVVGELNGKPATHTYKAKDADDLKQQNKEAFALYDQWTRQPYQVVVAGGALLQFRAANAGMPVQVAPRGQLGVALSPQPAADGGVGVLMVLPNTRAAAMGVQVQDVIVKVNDQPVADADALKAELQKHLTGLILEVKRDGKTVTLKE